MPRHLQFDYLQDFIELLAPNGIAVFQIPDGPEYHHPNEWLSMNADIVKLGGRPFSAEAMAEFNARLNIPRRWA